MAPILYSSRSFFPRAADIALYETVWRFIELPTM
jgi:hypothetical protein